MDIINLIEAIRKTQSTNAKLELLKKNKDNEILKKILYYTYNPFYKYYIRNISGITFSDSSVENGYDFEDMFKLLDELRNRIYTGN
ncbi:MAG TPA: hypothetical protein P5513_02700, partial [Candidatus Diapherotrites archaeon]|nr:hypothetical protein [Candidatus Diapherotrites archaeon]